MSLAITLIILSLVVIPLIGGVIYYRSGVHKVTKEKYKKIPNTFMNANGGDLQHLNTSVDGCKNACENKLYCASFVHSTDSSDCYLRSLYAGKPYHAKGWDSYIKN
jgi:hypothetical protein